MLHNIYIDNCPSHHSQFTFGHCVALRDNAVRLWRQEARPTIYSTTSRPLLGQTCSLQLRAQSLLPDTVMVLSQRAAGYTRSVDVQPTPLMKL